MVENVVQALARIVVFEQMARVDKTLREYDDPANGKRFKVVLTVHDEVVLVVPEEHGQWALEMVLAEMSKPPSWCSSLPVACEGDIGRSYGDAK
jgi:DNA polymerase I-like protein with 3'-5' exonuclease and polymerase domains